MLTQPYVASIASDGETALMYFDGAYSHAIRKGALLEGAAEQACDVRRAQAIAARTARADELAVGAIALAALEGPAPLYARVDLVRDEAGRPRVLELELAEPSLYFDYGSGSAERFAARVLARLAA